MAKESKKKRTQLEVLESIENLLKPINNITRYYIQQLNAQIEAQNKAAEEKQKEDVKVEKTKS